MQDLSLLMEISQTKNLEEIKKKSSKLQNLGNEKTCTSDEKYTRKQKWSGSWGRIVFTTKDQFENQKSIVFHCQAL